MKPVAVIGIPFDKKSSFLSGASEGPLEIRRVLNDGSSNFWTETGIELKEGIHFSDTGDILVEDYLIDIESGIDERLRKHDKIITLGGDHSIAYPIIKSVAKKYPDLSILQLDAHTDLYSEFEGDKFSHACPFYRIMEDGLVSHLTQVGIRNVPDVHREHASRFSIDIITMRDWASGKRPTFNGPLYISLDLDVFDPGFVPGVSHHEPGGMSPREVLGLIFDINVPIVGADIVELNPRRDHEGMTAMVGAKFLKEIAGKMISEYPTMNLE